MPPKTVPSLNSAMCRRLAIFSAVIGPAFLIIDAVLWAVPAWAPIVARGTANLDTGPITLTPVVRLIGFALSTLYLCVLVYGLWTARRLFQRLAAGGVFEPQTGVLLRRFGTALVVYAALPPFVSALMSLLVTMYNPPHQRRLTFGLSDHEIVLAIVGTLILATGSIMAEAARIAEEHSQIV
jgi:hypothetical protein